MSATSWQLWVFGGIAGIGVSLFLLRGRGAIRGAITGTLFGMGVIGLGFGLAFLAGFAQTETVTWYSVNSDVDIFGLDPWSNFCSYQAAQDAANQINGSGAVSGVDSTVLPRRVTVYQDSGEAAPGSHELTGYTCRRSLAEQNVP